VKFTRRELLKLGAGAGAALALSPQSILAGSRPRALAPSTKQPRSVELLTKPIPSTGEEIPIIGIGTRDYNTNATREQMTQFRETLAEFVSRGGTLIDTAAGYGRSTSETVLGDLIGELGATDEVFWATKVDREEKAAGAARIEGSFDKLQSSVIDLLAVHNLRGTAVQLATIRELKVLGRVRYAGVTTSRARQYPDMMQTIEREELDFVQVDYSLGNRGAEARILPMCADKGIATMINLPYARGRLFEAVSGMDLPDWASEWAGSWGQFFLKYVVSHPAVTAAIPGTTKPYHVIDNLGAARGWLPDAATRTRMETFFEAL